MTLGLGVRHLGSAVYPANSHRQPFSIRTTQVNMDEAMRQFESGAPSQPEKTSPPDHVQ